MAKSNGNSDPVGVVNGEKNGDAPPQYSAENNQAPTQPEDPSIDDLNSAFASLNLPSQTKDVTPDTCLAHLKLLAAFHNLQEDIGYTDGLWGLFDSRVLSQADRKAKAVEKGLKLHEKTEQRLANIREKRWALFIARAVDRYETWWDKLSTTYLTESDMEDKSERYTDFTTRSSFLSWAENILPPLGKFVLSYHSLGISY